MQYVSLVISFASLMISLISFLINNRRNRYMVLDDTYRNLLSAAITHPQLRNPEFTRNYLSHKGDDNDAYTRYCTYALQIWNFIETIYDLNNAKKDRKFFMKTWLPVVVEENKLHFEWFKRNTKFFKHQFVDFVYDELNEFVVRNLNDIKNGSEKLNEIFAAYDKAFPENERKSHEHLESLFKKGYEVFVGSFEDIYSEEQRDIGYAFCKVDSKKGLVFLDYLNVYEEYRSQGFGGVMLETLLENKLHKAKEMKAVVLEIEKVPKNASHKSEKYRRLNFYLSHRARYIIKDGYAIPEINGGKVELDLILVPKYRSTYVKAKDLKHFITETELFIHSDFSHTKDVINSYLDKIHEVGRIKYRK